MRFLILLAIVSVAAIAPVLGEKKIVCYLGSWSTYRRGEGKFDIENIDPHICTHVIYGFVGIDNDDVKVLDPELDLNRKGFARFNALRKQNPALKTLVAVGGWNEASIHFSKTASSPASRARFAKNVVAFVKKHGFDGFDMDWEYPGQREGSSPNDRENFVALLRELRQAFDRERLILTAAVAAAESSASKSYKIAEISKYLDFINLMAYDFRGSWEQKTGMHAALYAGSSEKGAEATLNVKAIVEYWMSQGAPKDKLILGVPTYGRSFTVSSGRTAVGSPASGAGKAGPYTAEPGMLGYNEICEQQKQGGWQIMFDEERRVPYASKGDQWVGYDNVMSVKEKAEFANKMGLGGAMVWALETDDFRGNCGEKFPLIKTLNHVLRNGQAVSDQQPISSPGNTDEAPVQPDDQPPEISPDQGNDGICRSAGIIADPSSCERYFACVDKGNGEFIKYSSNCPTNLCFDAAKGVCDWKR